jgi:hypothetical protein
MGDLEAQDHLIERMITMPAPLTDKRTLYADWQIRIEVPDAMLEDDDIEEALEIASDAVAVILNNLRKKYPEMKVYQDGLHD